MTSTTTARYFDVTTAPETFSLEESTTVDPYSGFSYDTSTSHSYTTDAFSVSTLAMSSTINVIISSSSTKIPTPKLQPRKPLTLDDILGQYWEYNAANDLCLYGYPCVFILGTIGNLFSFMVMLRSTMRKRSTGFYMAVLAVFDALVLFFACFRQWLSLLQDFEVLSLSSASCKIFNFLSYTFFDIAVWLLVVMTMERFVAVQFPLLAPKVATLKNARIALGVLVVLLAGLNAHFMWTVDLDSRGRCKYTEDHSDFHDNIWPWIDATFYSFLPFVLLLVFNILIIIVHRRATVMRKTTIRVHRSEMSSATNAGTQFRLSTMLLTVTITFLLLSAPNVILICIRHKYFDFSTSIRDFRDLAVYRFVAMVTNFCLYLNHAVNFLLYCISGQRFRRELINLLTCRSRPGRRTFSNAFSDVTTRIVRVSESTTADVRSVRLSESSSAPRSPTSERRENQEDYM